MSNQEKLVLLEEMMELEEGTLRLETELSEISEWDSMAALSLIVLLEDDFNRKISGKEIKGFKTVNDIINIMC